MKRIPVYHRARLHGWTLVDDADYDALIERLWKAKRYPDGRTYAVTYETGGGTLPIHRLLLGLEPGDGLDGDHIDGDPLNNQRSNLRPVTRAQNIQNRRGANSGARSRYRGVSYCKATGKWAVTVTVDRVPHWLGRHATEEEANRVAVAFRAQHMPFSTDFVEREKEMPVQEVLAA